MRKEELENYLRVIAPNSELLRMELDEPRSNKEGIPKAHYKFIYRSDISTKNKAGEIVTNLRKRYFTGCSFRRKSVSGSIETQIQTDWVKITEDPLIVPTPDINRIIAVGDNIILERERKPGIFTITKPEGSFVSAVNYRMGEKKIFHI